MIEEQGQLKYCLYARKSSEAEERQALSIDSQIKEMMQIAIRENLEIVETIQESKSAKDSGNRDGYMRLLQGIEERRFNAIITWAPDRLSRNAGDLGKLVDLMDRRSLKQIRTSGQTFTNTPDEKFLLMILCSQAKLENDNRSKNVKRGLRTKCEMGIRPGLPPIGYKLIRSDNFGEPSKLITDQERAPYIKKMFDYLVNSKISGINVCEYINEEGFRTNKGRQIPLSMIYKIFRETFYYGEFEYPKGSGNWYKGIQEPIITKEIFLKAQEILDRTSYKGEWGRKSFYFNKIFKCGVCGSGISGDEKMNKDGTRNIYYRCNKYRGAEKCNAKYIKEEKILDQLTEKVGQIIGDNMKINKKMAEELDKINRLLKNRGQIMTNKEYLKDLLINGATKDKSEILECIDGQLVLKDGVVGILS